MTTWMESENGSRKGRSTRWPVRLLEGVFLISAGTVIVGMLLGLFALSGLLFGRHSLVEGMLVGGAVGALWGVLKVTGFEHALSFGIGMLVGSEVGMCLGGFYNAVWAASLGGCVGMLLQRVFFGAQRPKNQTQIPVVNRLQALFIAMAGVVVGGISGAHLSAWLCMIIVSLAWPEKMNGNMYQAGFLISAVGMLGGIVGAGFGGRWLYLFIVRRSSPRADRNQTIREYECWKQEHLRCTQEEEPVENQYSATEAGAKPVTHG